MKVIWTLFYQQFKGVIILISILYNVTDAKVVFKVIKSTLISETKRIEDTLFQILIYKTELWVKIIVFIINEA